MRENKKEWIAFIIITSILLIWKFSFHELWKDEWQAWLVARDQSFGQLFSFLNYEGHPALWYLFLKPFTLLSNLVTEDFLLKVIHSFPLILAFYILFLKFRSPLLIKILASLSYFLFFEYGVVCRGYVLVILFCFLTIYSIKNNKYLLQAISIFLLCQTEVYGVMISFILLFYQYFDVKNIQQIKQPLIAFLTGALVFIISVYPRGNEDDFSRAYNKEKFSIETIKESFQGNIANTFGIGVIEDTSSAGATGVGILLSILLLTLSIYLLKNDRKILNTWVFGFSAFILFGIIIYTGGVRQWGMLFLLFICLLELYEPYIKNKLTLSLISMLLLAPVYHNVTAMVYEYKMPFTNAKYAGQFIKDKIPENVPIVSLNKFETANAAAYAKRKFYELPGGQPFTYFKWLEKIYLPTQTELVLFTKFKKVKGIVIIAPKPIDEKRFPFLKLWEEFNTESIKNENYYFYILNMEQLGGN